MKKGFTLAEILIVLLIIGILSTIIISGAKHIVPNKSLVKLEKTKTGLIAAISELINSDKYYLNGDFGIRANGNLIDGTHEGDLNYLCNNMANILKIKENNCKKIYDYYTTASSSFNELDSQLDCGGSSCTIYEKLDYSCTLRQFFGREANIILKDGVTIYQTSPYSPFGLQRTRSTGQLVRIYLESTNGFSHNRYNSFCIDIDGIPKNATEKNCINECPYGFGINVDGKIMFGVRAQKLLKRQP